MPERQICDVPNEREGESINIENRIEWAKKFQPRDPLTWLARTANFVLARFSTLFPVFTAFGLLFVRQNLKGPEDPFGWSSCPLYPILMSTSRWWIEEPILRPFLFAPGLLTATIARWLMQLNGVRLDGRRVFDHPMALTDQWPISWYLVNPPSEPLYPPSPFS